jgi:intein/homing endonuclease
MKIDNLVNKILNFGQKIGKIKLRPYQYKRAGQIVKAVILHEPGIWSTLWARKCLTGDSLIWMADGRCIPLRYVKSGEKILSLSPSEELEEDIVEDVWETSEKKIGLKILTRYGLSLKPSLDHLMTTPQGYLKAKKLVTLRKKAQITCVSDNWKRTQTTFLSSSTNAWIGAAKQGIFGVDSIGEKKAGLLGYLIADGYYAKGQSVKFTNINPKLLVEAASFADEFDLKAKFYPKGNGFDIIFSSESKASELAPNKLINWLREIKIFGQTKEKKIIPDIIFTLKKNEIALFINRLYAADGWPEFRIYDEKRKNRKPRIEFGCCASSELFALQLQMLLYKFGIHSFIKPQGKIYIVESNDPISIQKFYEQIGPIYGKENRSLKVYQASLAPRKYFHLRHNLGTDIDWPSIKELQGAEIPEKMWDLRTKKNHNFIANGFVVHNSGKSEMLKVTMLALMTLLPELSKTYLSKEFPRLKLFRDGLNVAFAGPKEAIAKIPFIRLRRQARQKKFVDILESLDMQVIASNSVQFELSNGSTATAFSGSETAANEGPGAECIDGDAIIVTSRGKITLAELVFRFRLGKKFDILSVGKSGLEFKKLLAVSSEFKKKSLRIYSSNKKSLGLGYEHPVATRDSYKQAQWLEEGENLCTLNNFKLFSDQRSEMGHLQNMEEVVFATGLNKKNIYSGNMINSKTLLMSPRNVLRMVGGVIKSGGFPHEVFQKLKNSENLCTPMAKKLFPSKFWKNLNHLVWQYGGKMMEATRMETVLCTPNVLPMKNINFFKNSFLSFGKSEPRYEIQKNEESFFISSIFQKFHFLFYQKLLNLISSRCFNIRSENRKNVKSVGERFFVEAGPVVQSNTRRKENNNETENYGQKIAKQLNLFVISVAKYLQVSEIILQKLAQLSAIGNKKINYSETGDLKKESLLNHEVHITQIEHLNQEKELFDLMVEENHNFFANGILVHNCLLVDEAALLSPFSLYKILHPMVAHVDGLISLTGNPGRKKCPFLTAIDYNKRKFPHLNQEVTYKGVIPYSKDYASYIDSEIDRLPGGITNPFFRMNYLLEWLIAEGHFIDFAQFLKLGVGQRDTDGGRLVAGVDWGKVTSSTTVTILEDKQDKVSVTDLFEIKGDWDYQFEYLIPFLKEHPGIQTIFSESTGSGDPLTTKLAEEFGEDIVHHKFMSAPYKDKIFTNLNTEITAKPSRFEYFDDDSEECKSFIRQFLDAEQEVKGKLLVVRKPEDEGSADDFLFSTALALDALLSTTSVKIEYQTTGQKRTIYSEMEDL